MSRYARLYDQALDRAQAAQSALVRRMRALKSTLPSWASYQEAQALLEADAEARRLAQASSDAWQIVELRRKQLMSQFNAKQMANDIVVKIAQ